MKFEIEEGIVTGRHHIVYGINCQDSAASKSFVYKDQTYLAGIVADGCGEGTRSETGAHLATSFLLRRIENLIRESVSPREIPTSLFWDLLRFLGSIVDGYKLYNLPHTEVVTFIKDHLLFTVLGFIVGPTETVVFATGDGVVVLNDIVDIRDQENMPTYPAYHLVDAKYLSQKRTKLPRDFDTQVIATSKLKRLAVGTDAWGDELGALLSIWSKGSSRSLQRAMNVMSNKEKRFKDDAALIAVQKQE